MAAMASSAAVSCAASASAARLGSRSKSGVPARGVKVARRAPVTTSAAAAGGADDFIAPSPAPAPPPQVFNAASIKVRAHAESDHAPDLPGIFRYAKFILPTPDPGRAVYLPLPARVR